MVNGMTVFNSSKVDTKKQPMFFGAPLGVQRYDSYKYPTLINLHRPNWDISGGLKRYLYRKIEQIIIL